MNVARRDFLNRIPFVPTHIVLCTHLSTRMMWLKIPQTSTIQGDGSTREVLYGIVRRSLPHQEER